MRIQFRVSICDECRLSAHDHVLHDGEIHDFVGRHAGKWPTLPADCKCTMVPIGGCSFCNRPVEDMEIAAQQYHFDLSVRDPETGDEVFHPSLCGNCVVMIVGMMQNPGIAQRLVNIIQAMEPKVVPASAIPTAADVVKGSAHVGGRIVPIPDRTRRR